MAGMCDACLLDVGCLSSCVYVGVGMERSGYDWRDAYPSRWDYALKSMVDVCSMVPPENSNPTLLRQLAVDQEPSAEEEEKEEEEKEEQVESKLKAKDGEEGEKEEQKADEAEEEESKEEAAKEEVRPGLSPKP